MPKIEAFQKYTSEYDNWFVINRFAYLSEIEAVKKALSQTNGVIEIGIGSGIFAEPLVNLPVQPLLVDPDSLGARFYNPASQFARPPQL